MDKEFELYMKMCSSCPRSKQCHEECEECEEYEDALKQLENNI